MIAKLFAGAVAVLCLAVVGLSFHCGGFHCCDSGDNDCATMEPLPGCDPIPYPVEPKCCTESVRPTECGGTTGSACCEDGKDKVAADKNKTAVEKPIAAATTKD